MNTRGPKTRKYLPRIRIPSTAGTYERIINSHKDRERLNAYMGNKYTVQVSIVVWASLLGDSPTGPKPDSTINKFVNSLLDDYAGVSDRFAELSDAGSRLIYHDHESRVLITKDFLDAFKGTPIFKEYLHFYKERCPTTLRFILSFLELGRKIGYVDSDLNTRAFRSWREVEDKLITAELPTFIDSLRSVVHWMFETGWVEDVFLPKHGSGAVAEKGVWGAVGKNEAMRLDPKIAYKYQRSEDGDICTALPNGAWCPSRDANLSVARLRFVPKDIRKTRSICMEPIDFMWAQQGVRLWYERWLEEGVLAHHVRLKDQTFNQILCWHGSITSELATIDLSSASDSVSLKLVKAVFPPKVLKHLLATRSRLVDTGFDEEPIRVEKFAPMGSALCFPVQCTIFAAVVLMVSIATVSGRAIFEGETISDLSMAHQYLVAYGAGEHAHFKKFAVYGDDIICDKQVVSNVMRALTELSFSVNVEKSYFDDVAYRESCGMHSFNGYDVTPFKLKTKPISTMMSLEALLGLVDAANNAAEYGYTRVYSALVNVTLRWPIEGVRKNRGFNPILFAPLDSEESCAIKTSRPRNTHLKTRGQDNVPVATVAPDLLFYGTKAFGPYQPIRLPFGCRPIEHRRNDRFRGPTHEVLQRKELCSLAVDTIEQRSADEETDPYYHGLWWRTRYGYDEVPSDIEGIAKADTKGVRVRWRWTAA
jgi:hypothetical protein